MQWQEWMGAGLVERWAGWVTLINVYGCTECTVYQAGIRIPLDQPHLRRCIGQPLGHLRLCLLLALPLLQPQAIRGAVVDELAVHEIYSSC